MRFAFIAAEKAVHSVAILCRCLRVTRSGFYAWTTRGLSARAQRDLVLRTKLRAFHVASGQRYGRPNLWKDLQEDGEAVSEKRVARLMRVEAIQGKVRRRFKTTTMSMPTRSRRMSSTAILRLRVPISGGSATPASF
jgi:putative transposase